MTVANVTMEFVVVGVCVLYVLFASQRDTKIGRPIWFSLIFLSASTLLGHTEFTSSSLAEALVGNALMLTLACAICAGIHILRRQEGEALEREADRKAQDQPRMNAVVINSIAIYAAVKLSALMPGVVTLLGRSVQLPIPSLVPISWLSIGIAILGFFLVALTFERESRNTGAKSGILSGVSFLCLTVMAALIPVQLRLAILKPSLSDLGPSWSVVGNDLLENLSTRCFFISFGCLFLGVVLLLLHRRSRSKGSNPYGLTFIACNSGLLALVLACFSELWRAEY